MRLSPVRPQGFSVIVGVHPHEDCAVAAYAGHHNDLAGRKKVSQFCPAASLPHGTTRAGQEGEKPEQSASCWGAFGPYGKAPAQELQRHWWHRF
jgi:hypothetical protein